MHYDLSSQVIKNWKWSHLIIKSYWTVLCCTALCCIKAELNHRSVSYTLRCKTTELLLGYTHLQSVNLDHSFRWHYSHWDLLHLTLQTQTCLILDTLRRRWPVYRGEAAAHVSVGHGEAGLVDGLLEDQIDDPFEPLFCIDGQVRHLLHQLVELLRSQLVQDAAYLPEELLRGISHKKAVNHWSHQSVPLLWHH